MKALCLNYSKDYTEEHVQLMFTYAKEDIDKGIMTWDLFFKALKECGRTCNFFPTYSKILEQLTIIKEKNRTINPMQLEKQTKLSEKEKKELKKLFKKYREEKFNG